MAAAITLTPASGSITAGKTVVRVNITGADDNTETGYSTSIYPQSPARKYYLLFDAPTGTDDKRSYVFNVSNDGTHEFNNFVFDAAGAWTVRFRNSADDSDVTTAAVTVS